MKITEVVLYKKDMCYEVIGDGFPNTIKKFEEYGEWDTIHDTHDSPLFDVQIDEEEEGIYSFQYVRLKFNSNTGYYENYGDYLLPDKFTICEQKVTAP